jgi:hypothetical protein
MKSQLPHRQASRQPYTRLGKQLLGLIADVAVGTKMVQGRETLDWLNLGELFSTSLCYTSCKDWQKRRFSFA